MGGQCSTLHILHDKVGYSNRRLCQRIVGRALPCRSGTSHPGKTGRGWPPGQLTVLCALPERCPHSAVREPPSLRDQLGHL